MMCGVGVSVPVVPFHITILTSYRRVFFHSHVLELIKFGFIEIIKYNTTRNVYNLVSICGAAWGNIKILHFEKGHYKTTHIFTDGGKKNPSRSHIHAAQYARTYHDS